MECPIPPAHCMLGFLVFSGAYELDSLALDSPDVCGLAYSNLFLLLVKPLCQSRDMDFVGGSSNL